MPAVCMMLGSLLLMRAQISAKVQAVFQARRPDACSEVLVRCCAYRER